MMKMLIAAVGLLGLTTAAHADSARIGFGAGQSLDVKEFLSEARASKAPDAPIRLAAPATETNPQMVKPGQDVEWVAVDGGEFMMGSDAFDNRSKPAHKVSVKTFEMSKTLVTVEQYAQCVSAGACSAPGTSGYCNWGKAGRQRYPVNCVDWDQANRYAGFKGARLPSEAEWEYAATDGGRTAVSGYGCDSASDEPVCANGKGNTALGLCNMMGNVFSWVQDRYRFSYDGAPVDGSAFEGPEPGTVRVARGGAYGMAGSCKARLFNRASALPGDKGEPLGFRLARSR